MPIVTLQDANGQRNDFRLFSADRSTQMTIEAFAAALKNINIVDTGQFVPEKLIPASYRCPSRLYNAQIGQKRFLTIFGRPQHPNDQFFAYNSLQMQDTEKLAEMFFVQFSTANSPEHSMRSKFEQCATYPYLTTLLPINRGIYRSKKNRLPTHIWTSHPVGCFHHR